jgi:hypothetical protein
MLDGQSGERKTGGPGNGGIYPDQSGGWAGGDRTVTGYTDKGGASRFFYCSKASRRERNDGLGKIGIVMAEWGKSDNGGLPQWENEVQRVRLLVDTEQSPPRVTGAYMIPEAGVSEWNTFLFGNNIWEQFRPASVSITETETRSTTELRIWKYLTSSLTRDCTRNVKLLTGNGGSRAENAESSSLSLSFTSGKTVLVPGVGNVASKTLWRISVSGELRNTHSTVKPLALMEYLCTLTRTPTGGIVLDPFMGSGSTGVACVNTGRDFVGIERAHSSFKIAERRIEHALNQARQLEFIA